ncbi:class I SAM-dependent methyltransferase [Paenibacillus flagellatus]|uniref:SAM-dependent methyltransferase n=1 Tax=Paenibacillus flagellatus TaxID=2211139 RepID=A0A2V5JY39_9BACL|nr:class I SAM-dependent methyltransferase [Paenibacillus flagellatus]PYI51779.1 SAM-dependent methyltransferase [Paenibacillus flagellatus]
MPIDFHDERNRGTYASRSADAGWTEAIGRLVDARGLRAADIGCGGGIYTRALAGMGAKEVIAVDFSAGMLAAAAEHGAGLANVRFVRGEAAATGLPGACVDLVLERALIHHVSDLFACFAEAYRLLRPGGTLLVQDRTPEDCLLPGGPDHIRGFLFELYPKLAAVETARRHDSAQVETALARAGFGAIRETKLWEVRRSYGSAADIADDWRGRKGRSILHELSDDELERLIAHIRARLPAKGAIEEKDRWTVWAAVKP